MTATWLVPWALVPWGMGLALLWPLLVAASTAIPGRFPGLGGMWLSAPLPALALAFAAPAGSVELDWWLLGGVWEIDAMRRALLAFIALLWWLAGVYARGYLAEVEHDARREDWRSWRRLQCFALLWPLTLVGVVLLVIAEDIASFYTGFALMTFAAYGLVVNDGSARARRGGLAYLIMALLGEGMILGGLLWSAGATGALALGELREGMAGDLQGEHMALLLWLGFGVKAGVVGLHVWLPLAHPVAPTPASAILSGAMIKAGLLGWLQALPLGLVAFDGLGRAVLAAGLLAAFGAALYGITQRQAKAVMAYSSVSQMGMMTALVGAGLLQPSLWPALAPVMVLFAMHHGLNKGALFLGVGITEHPPRLPAWLTWTLLLLPGVSLAGVLASGLATKGMMKGALYADWYWLSQVLSAAAVGTTLLVARALWRQRQAWRQAKEEGASPAPLAMTASWAACAVAAAVSPWWLPLPERPPLLLPMEELPDMLWPALLGVALAAVALAVGRMAYLQRLERLPPGDLWHAYVGVAHGVLRRARVVAGRLGARKRAMQARWAELEARGRAWLDRCARGEAWFHRLVVPAMVAVMLMLWGLLNWG